MKTRRILCLLLVMIMAFSIAFPASIFADDSYEEIELCEESEQYDEFAEEVSNEFEETVDELVLEDWQYFDTDENAYVEEILLEDENQNTAVIDDQIVENEDVIVENEDLAVPENDKDANVLKELAENEEIIELEEAESFDTVQFRIVTEPADASAPEGEKAKTTVVAEGEGLTYTWYFKNAGQSQFSKSSQNTAEFSSTMTSATNGRQVYCVVKDKNNDTLTTRTATLTLENIVVGDFEFSKIANTNNLALVKYTGNATSITVPDIVSNMTVTEIGMGVFEGRTELLSVALPNSITVIRERAFKGCTSLSTMTTYG